MHISGVFHLTELTVINKNSVRHSNKIENISKQYRLGTGTISHDLIRWWAKMRGKEDPTLKIGQANLI